MRTRSFREIVADHWDDPVRRARRQQFRVEMEQMLNEQPAPSNPDVEIDTGTETEPLRRLEPEKVCDAQRTRIGERVVRELP